jgi:hypothetical protein
MLQLGSGVSKAAWKIDSLLDGEYDMVIRLSCAPSNAMIPSGLMTYSALAKLVLDRAGPVEFAQHVRPSGPYFPGDDISVAFNEDIVCSAVAVSAKVSSGATLSQSEFLMACKDNSLFLDFSPSMSTLVWCCIWCVFVILSRVAWAFCDLILYSLAL